MSLSTRPGLANSARRCAIPAHPSSVVADNEAIHMELTTRHDRFAGNAYAHRAALGVTNRPVDSAPSCTRCATDPTASVGCEFPRARFCRPGHPAISRWHTLRRPRTIRTVSRSTTPRNAQWSNRTDTSCSAYGISRVRPASETRVPQAAVFPSSRSRWIWRVGLGLAGVDCRRG